MAKHYIEDSWRTPIQEMEVGDKFTTKWRILSATDVELFSLLGGIYNPYFLSEKAAKSTGIFKGQLVPGLCALNIAYGILIQAGFLKDILAYIETSTLRFVAPIYVGDRIKAEVEVTGVKETKKGWICDYDFNIENQDDVVVVTGHNL